MVEIFGVFLILTSLIVSLFAAPYYFRKLHRLTEAIAVHDPDEYTRLNNPSLKKFGANMSPASTLGLLGYILKKSYIASNNEDVISAGDKAFRALIISSSFMFLMFIGAFIVMAFSNGA